MSMSREADSPYRAVFDAARDAMIVYTREGVIVEANAAACRTYGYAREDLVGIDARDAVHPDARPHLEQFLRVVGGGGEFRCETVDRRRDGTVFPIEVTGTHFTYAGQPRLMAVVRDITEQKRAEEQLRRSHDTFYHLIQNDPFGVCVVDADFRLREVSRGGQKAFAHVPRPLLGRDFAEVLRCVWTEPFAGEATALFRRTLDTGEPYVATRTVERRADVQEIEAYDWRIDRVTLPDGRYGVVCYFYDLSERQRWEAALRANEQRFRALATASAAVLYQLSPDWSELQPLDGKGLIPSNDAPIRDWLEPNVAASDRAAVRDGIAHAIATKSPFDMEHRTNRPDGSVGWTRSRAVPVLDEAGEIVEWVGTAEDITDRKRAEEALQESEQRFRLMADSVPQIVWITDAEGRALFFNQQWSKYTGLDHVPATAADVAATVLHPDDGAATMAAFDEARRTGGTFAVEHRIRSAAGEYRWFLVRGEPHRDPQTGAITRWFGASVDIHDRRLAEERSRTILESINDAFYAVDADFRFTYVNRKAEQLWGRRRDELLGRHYWTEFPQAVGSESHRMHLRAMFERTPVQYETVSPLLGRWIDVSIYPEAGGGLSCYFRDVTERRRAEAEAARLAAMVRASRDGMFLLGRDRTIQTWNPGAQRVFGYAAEEVVGRDVSVLIPPDRQHEPQHLFERAVRGERVPETDTVRVRKDGSPVDVSVSLDPVLDADGGVVAAAATVRDITERKRAEEALRQAGERYRNLFESIDQGFCVVQVMFDAGGRPLDYRFLEANPAFERQTGLAGAVGRTARELVPTLEDRWFEVYGRVAATGQPVRFEESSDPMGRWFDVYAFRAGEPEGRRVAILFKDITEAKRTEAALRQSERRFRDMADTAPAMLWVTEPDGYCSFLSRGWYEFTGQTEAEGLGFGWTNAAHPDDHAAARDAFIAANAARHPYAVDFRIRRADGEYRWVIDAGRPRFGPGGEFLGFIGSVIDITDRKVAEDERNRLLDSERAARAEAERASRMKDEFLATLSHELRTPLNAILGWSQILATGTKDAEDLSEGLRTIERNARAQTQIIEDLLDMSRIISGKVRLDVQRIDLAGVVQAAVETVRPAADAKGTRIQAVLDPSAGPVSGDPSRLQQVFWNLLANAVKFTPRGGRVQVLLERVNSHLEVSVIDTGEGIAPEFLPHVFDRFRQADASTTRRHGGLGLGLSIVKQLVELHGGNVRVKSEGKGRGTTFTVSLPLTVIHLDPAPEPERRHPFAPSGNGIPSDMCLRLDGVKVLVVDDEPDARGLLRRLLEDCKAVVSVAGSAPEAIEALRRNPPDVLVSDIGMPGGDGYSLIQEVRMLGREVGGRVPAIALTAYARAEDRVRAIRAGYQMHASKPVEPAELIAMVASLAEHRDV